MTKLTCEFEYAGYSDYWRGRGGRGIEGGIATAFYGKDTTLRDLVDQWVEESWTNGHDFEGMPEDVGSDDVRDCILAMLSDAGRADYESGAVCEFAADLEEDRVCSDCGEPLGELHTEDCQYYEEDEDLEVVEHECDDDDCCESPVAHVWITWEKCPDCGDYSGDDTNDGLCGKCHDKHYSERSDNE